MSTYGSYGDLSPEETRALEEDGVVFPLPTHGMRKVSAAFLAPPPRTVWSKGQKNRLSEYRVRAAILYSHFCGHLRNETQIHVTVQLYGRPALVRWRKIKLHRSLQKKISSALWTGITLMLPQFLNQPLRAYTLMVLVLPLYQEVWYFLFKSWLTFYLLHVARSESSTVMVDRKSANVIRIEDVCLDFRLDVKPPLF